MSDGPTGRALQLLSLLQTHRWWAGGELAERMGVTERTVRRDVDRLRSLGYPVDASQGVHGGYRLAMGSHLPPLMLDDDEAVAVAIGLRHAAGSGLEGMDDAALRALMTISDLLPHALRRRVAAVQQHVASLPASGEVAVDPDALVLLAAACRDRERVRFDYRGADGEVTTRRVEPHEVVAVGGRWYLAAWDELRNDWRTFRLDRIEAPRAVGSRYAPRELPAGGATGLVTRAVGPTPKVEEALLSMGRSADALASTLRWIDHSVLESGEGECRVAIRAEDMGRLAMAVARLGLEAPVRIEHPPELAARVKRLAIHLTDDPA